MWSSVGFRYQGIKKQQAEIILNIPIHPCLRPQNSEKCLGFLQKNIAKTFRQLLEDFRALKNWRTTNLKTKLPCLTINIELACGNRVRLKT